MTATLTSIGQPIAASQPCNTVADCNRKINSDKQQQKNLIAQVNALKAEVASLNVKEAQVVAFINGLNTQIAQQQQAVAAAQHLVTIKQGELRAATTALDQVNRELHTAEQQLAGDVITAYEVEDQSKKWLNDLLKGGTFNDYFTTLVNANRISAAMRTSVGNVQTLQAKARVAVDNREREKGELSAALALVQAQLAALYQEKSAQQAAFAYYSQLEAQASAAEQQAAAANKALGDAVTALTKQRDALGSGKLVWPDPGPISQGFGCTVYSFEPYDASCPFPHRFHNGLDIAGPCGTPILAADTGIAYPQSFMSYGYGNWILVDHGAGMVTLYGHLSGYAVGDGQRVNRGQVIGYEGTTGNSTGCHLHFSVFVNDNAVNPLHYLPGRS